MGLYDTPSVIDLVKSKTLADKVIYVGHSQGATQILYGLSYLEEDYYHQNVLFAALFAPCTYLRHIPYVLANKLIFSLKDLDFDYLGGEDSRAQADLVC